jgi:hypothetical protein
MENAVPEFARPNAISFHEVVGARFIAPSARGMARILVSEKNKKIVIPSEARNLLFSSVRAVALNCELSAVSSFCPTFNLQLSTVDSPLPPHVH